jgi:hypothetical protein
VILTVLPDLPRSLVVAGKWWFVAIGAAVFETVLAAAHALITAGLTLPEVLTQVVVRLIVFAAASWLTLQLLQGRNAARVALTVLLSMFGLLSLLIAPVEWLTAGHQMPEAFRDLSVYDVTFGASRVVHVLAVIFATTFMYQRSANRFISGRMSRALLTPGN